MPPLDFGALEALLERNGNPEFLIISREDFEILRAKYPTLLSTVTRDALEVGRTAVCRTREQLYWNPPGALDLSAVRLWDDPVPPPQRPAPAPPTRWSVTGRPSTARPDPPKAPPPEPASEGDPS